ncbi:COP9 signalosome complex subunit 4 [Perkinsus olseni]|uniref:COP9 signalosome complex subunit 4 n=1 Tax=Perkinsus olseni TaxID=32597 RepID=A0A7J6M3Z4_PEROL|nr:COP9 signalosome complex subunit 4 [Perkinsus olseni]
MSILLTRRSRTVERRSVRCFAPRRQSKKDLYKLEFMDHIETGVNPARIPMQFLYQKVEDQPPKELAYTIHTAARLRVANKELFNKAIAAAADMAHEMKPSYTVGILFGTLWIAKHWPTNTNDVKVLYTSVIRDIHRLQGVDIAYLLKAASAFSEECGTLCKPELQKLIQMVPDTISTSNVRSITECMGAMAKLKMTSQAALTAISRQLTYQMESVRVVDIPTIFRSYVNLLPLMPQPLASPSPHQALLEAACSSLCARISLMEVEQISITVAALGKLSKFDDWWRPSGTAVCALAAALAEHLPLLQAEMIPSLMLNLGLASENAPAEARSAIDSLLRRMASASVRGVRNQTASALASTIHAAESLRALEQDMPSLLSLTKVHLQRKLTTTTIESLAGILGNIPSNTVRTCIAEHLVQRLESNLCKTDDYVRIAITAGVEGNREVSSLLIEAALSKPDFPSGALIAMRDARGEPLEAAAVPDVCLIDAVIGYGRASSTICGLMLSRVRDADSAISSDRTLDASTDITLPLPYQRAAVYLIHHLQGRCKAGDDLVQTLLQRIRVDILNITELSLLARFSPLAASHPVLIPLMAKRCLQVVASPEVLSNTPHEGDVHSAKLLCRVLSLLCKVDRGDSAALDFGKLRNLICQVAVRHATHLFPSDFVSLCALVVQSGYHKIPEVRLSLGDILGPCVLVKMRALKSAGAKERLAGLCRTMGFEAIDLSEKLVIIMSCQSVYPSQHSMQYPNPQIQPPGQVQMATVIGNPMPVIQPNVVDGMQVVAGLKRVQVRELRQMLEAITGFEQRNKYIVKDEAGRELFYAVEESNACERNCYPPDCAPWDLHIYVLGPKGLQGDLIHWLTVHRPCTCTCLCANRPVAYVTETSTDHLLGTLHDPYACCDLTFKIKDAAGNDVITGVGGCCQWGMCFPLPCGPCQHIGLQLSDSMNNFEVGKIDKYWMWGDCCPICFKEQDNYWITFGEVENPRWKALLLALGIFMDFRICAAGLWSVVGTMSNSGNSLGGGGSALDSAMEALKRELSKGTISKTPSPAQSSVQPPNESFVHHQQSLQQQQTGATSSAAPYQQQHYLQQQQLHQQPPPPRMMHPSVAGAGGPAMHAINPSQTMHPTAAGLPAAAVAAQAVRRASLTQQQHPRPATPPRTVPGGGAARPVGGNRIAVSIDMLQQVVKGYVASSAHPATREVKQDMLDRLNRLTWSTQNKNIQQEVVAIIGMPALQAALRSVNLLQGPSVPPRQLAAAAAAAAAANIRQMRAGSPYSPYHPGTPPSPQPGNRAPSPSPGSQAGGINARGGISASSMLRRPMPMNAVERERHLARAVCMGGDVKVLAGIDIGYEQALLRLMYSDEEPAAGPATAASSRKKKKRPALLPAEPVDKRQRLAIPLSMMEGQNEEYLEKIPLAESTVRERLSGTTAFRGGLSRKACNAMRAVTWTLLSSLAGLILEDKRNLEAARHRSSQTTMDSGSAERSVATKTVATKRNMINGQSVMDTTSPIMSIFNFPQKLAEDLNGTQDGSLLEYSGNAGMLMEQDRTTAAHVHYTLNLMPARFSGPCGLRQLPLKIPRQFWPVCSPVAMDPSSTSTSGTEKTLRDLNAAYPDTRAMDEILRCEHENIDHLLNVARMVISDPTSADNQHFTRAVIQSLCRITSHLPNSTLEDFSMRMLDLLSPASAPSSADLDRPSPSGNGCPAGLEDEITRLRVNLSEIHQAAGEFLAAAMDLDRIDADGRGGAGPPPSLRSSLSRCEHFTKIAELYLEGGDDVSAESYISRAAMIVPDLGDDDVGLQLRFKVCQARIFDARRKFLDAAYKYLEVALGPHSSSIDADDISQLLLGAARCVVLAPAGPKKRRILQMITSDSRCEQAIPSCEWDVLTKVKNFRIIYPRELKEFEKGLSEHHLALGPDGKQEMSIISRLSMYAGLLSIEHGMTVLSRAITEHNIVAISHLYSNISLSRLGGILDETPAQVEILASNMIAEERLKARIDQLSQYMLFDEFDSDAKSVSGWARNGYMATVIGSPIAQASVVDGMQVVAGLKRVQVRELRQMLEAITGFEQRNKYIVKDEAGRELFYAVEESNACERNCYPPDCAPWDLHIYVLGPKGLQGDLIHWLTVHRPCTCTCLCANRPVAYVTETSTDQLLGTLHDPYACCDLTFKIKDAAGNDVITGVGGCCQWGMCFPLPCGPCHHIGLQLSDSMNNFEVGKIDKYWMWGDCCPICFKEQDNYWITFGEVENPRWKALLLALGIFMDFRYFTQRNQA